MLKSGLLRASTSRFTGKCLFSIKQISSTEIVIDGSKSQVTKPSPTKDEVAKIKQDLFIPKTDFKIRFNGAKSEVRYQKNLTDKLYRWQLQDLQRKDSFTIHNTPLMAYGDLHLGHFFSYTQSDILNRFKILNNYRIVYQHCFNCHATIIESTALTQERERIKQFREFSHKEI